MYCLQQPGQSYSYEPSGYASSSLAAAPPAAYGQSEIGQPQYAVHGILFFSSFEVIQYNCSACIYFI